MKLTLIHEDSETSAIPGTNAAKKLVEINKVVAIVGALASGVTIPVAESVTLPNSVLQISNASTSPMITVLPADKDKDLLFRTCPSDALQGVISGKLAADLGYKKASTLYVNNPYGQGLAEQFKKSFEARGGKVLAMVPHDEKAAPTYTAELKKALAGKPDTIGAFSYPGHSTIYLKEAIELFKFNNFLFCDGTKSIKNVEVVGAENVEGLYGTAPGSALNPSYDAFLAEYAKAYGSFPKFPFVTNAYDAMSVIGLAILKAQAKGQPITSLSIRDNLRTIANPPGEVIRPGEFKKAAELIKQGKDINYEGAAGSVDFDKNGDVITPIEVWKYHNGDMVTVRMEFEIPKE
ncbi:MAG: ABC transporter substrate-binding protein [Deltaproteobacteria bacterium]|nr:ABC transporter substrate-binding protein [Deltaproteobacteria bacterium]MBW2306388.1 ABC transporter substrate-binding protein [Deltaproteobacteria bacterium]